MKKLIILTLTALFLLPACTGKRYAFRKTIPYHVRAVEAVRPEEQPALAETSAGGLPVAPDTVEVVHNKADQHVSHTTGTVYLKKLAKTPVLQQVVSFTPDQLLFKPHAGTLAPRAGTTPVLPVIALVCSLLSVVLLLLVIVISSYMVGVIFVFLSPALAALGLILGWASLTEGAGKGNATAAMIIGGMVLLLTLIVLLVLYLFLQSRSS